MNVDTFYQRLVKIAAQPPYPRYEVLAEFHTGVVMRYLNTIQIISERRARRTGSDGRTVAQVIGHIAEWERFIILAAGEIVAGVKRPRIMELSHYLDLDGRVMDFSSVDNFNAYQMAKHAKWPWLQIQDMAIHTATALHTMFTQPTILSPETLEKTHAYDWRLPNGIKLTLPIGWYLWMITLEHEAVSHALDLGWE